MVRDMPPRDNSWAFMQYLTQYVHNHLTRSGEAFYGKCNNAGWANPFFYFNGLRSWLLLVPSVFFWWRRKAEYFLVLHTGHLVPKGSNLQPEDYVVGIQIRPAPAFKYSYTITAHYPLAEDVQIPHNVLASKTSVYLEFFPLFARTIHRHRAFHIKVRAPRVFSKQGRCAGEQSWVRMGFSGGPVRVWVDGRNRISGL